MGTVQATISPSGHGHISEIAWVAGTPWQGGSAGLTTGFADLRKRGSCCVGFPC